MKKRKEEKKSYAVFGMGEFGKSVAITLAANNVDVMAIDSKEEGLADVADYVLETKIMDATDVRAYEKIGLSNMDGVVIAITGNMEATLMAILQSVEANVQEIVVKALNDTQAKIFSRIGATRIVNPEQSEGKRLAKTVADSNIFEFVELNDHICLVEIPVKDDWVGKSLLQLDLRNRYHLNVIASIMEGHANMTVNPNILLQKDEHLLIAIEKENLDKLP